ncbi:hypothetical protein EV702DRAFT_1180521 [Suillus placidus]|uniref:Uncharacterized protein n=1 Tax=Suillus placidus TaxID=48579 RepID=A0A9P6ZR26_9AGAM|nr:hypothetical protein EV702DRAFT_1180521 [Suillus placidus]
MSETPHHVHARIGQENIQTANDMNLFDDDDNEMEDKSQTRFQFDTPKCSNLDNGTESDGDDSDGDGAAQQNDQPAVLPLKWRKLDVPYREQRRLAKETRLDEMKKALTSIEKLLKAKKTLFVGGPNRLQAKRTCSIQSYLTMVIKIKWLSIDASRRAAESHGFAANWGGRQVRSWTRLWVADRKLPESLQGRHAKVYSLLGDPTIATELRAYVCSNKWVVNPEKLIQLSQDKLIPAEATKYTQNLVEEEMPHGLKKYMELEIFPRNHLKVGRGISLSTARRWLRSQANDAVGQYWVFEDEFRLRKKGAGRGLHRSDVICSTVGHLVEAGETMEYGKNHEGYWCGENFCTQLTEKIIPTFERAHGPGYQALFLIDNSQGHSAYAEDALLVSRMHNGWFIRDGIRVEQEMSFPPDHLEHPGEPKGVKARYLCEHCDCTFDGLKANMPRALASVSLWLDAYRSGLGTKDAQLKVQQFSSTKYKSHRRVPETVAQLFD